MFDDSIIRTDYGYDEISDDNNVKRTESVQAFDCIKLYLFQVNLNKAFGVDDDFLPFSFFFS